MKKKIIILLSLILIIFSFTNIGYANMAAPKKDDISTNITFEKNEDISVLNEVLNIKIEKEIALIEAIYTMKNTKNEKISTKSMFISPNIEGNTILVTKNDVDINYISKSYYIKDEISTNDWQYVILEDDHYGIKVQTINFDLSFNELEEAIIKVKYKYTLGGYPLINNNLRRGSLYYYLTPANTWKGFKNLTINLELDNNLPKIRSSNLDFKKVGKRTYQYNSTLLPEENLKIELDLNAWQDFYLSFNNVYNRIIFLGIGALVIIIALIIIPLIIITRKRK